MLTESAIEAFAIKLLERQGFTYVHGPALAPEGEHMARCSRVRRTRVRYRPRQLVTRDTD